MTRDEVAKAYIAEFMLHAGKLETGGSNRSKTIDRFNKMAGAPLGTPYCCAAATAIMIDTCTKKGWKVPKDFRCDAGTQRFFERAQKLHPKYILSAPKEGAICIWQKRTKPHLGHAAACRGASKAGIFPTIEANTDASGSRDGDGFWAKHRFTKGNAFMRIRGYVDVCQWVADANP